MSSEERQPPDKVLAAIAKGQLPKLRKLLAASNINLDQTVEGELPLVEAVDAGIEYVSTLLQAGADVNAYDETATTALLRACERGKPEVVQTLLAAGADKEWLKDGVLNALMAAARNHSHQHLEVLKQLLDHGANPNALARSHNGTPTSSVLIRAAQAGNLEGVRQLLNAGVNINELVFFGTALTAATEEGHHQVVKILLEAGADPTIRLVDDPRLGDRAGKSALELARQKRHRRVVELLESPASPPDAVIREPGVPAAWKRLEVTLEAHRPVLLKSLRPGVADEDLTALAAALGRRLPAEVETFLKVHDGQGGGKRAAFISEGDEDFGNRFRFLRTTEIVREWRVWKELVEGGEFRDRKSLPDEGVRDDWYNLGWVPLTSDGLGDHHCLDLAPADGAHEGRIILVWHDREERTVVAESIEQWLHQLAEDLA